MNQLRHNMSNSANDAMHIAAVVVPAQKLSLSLLLLP